MFPPLISFCCKLIQTTGLGTRTHRAAQNDSHKRSFKILYLDSVFEKCVNSDHFHRIHVNWKQFRTEKKNKTKNKQTNKQKKLLTNSRRSVERASLLYLVLNFT